MFKVILSTYILLTAQNVFAQSMGPININIITTETCDGDEGYFDAEIIGLDDDTKGVNYNIKNDFPFDETVSYEIVADKIQNGQVSPGVFKTKGAYACKDFTKFLGDIWAKMLEAAGAPQECPTPEGDYRAEKFPFRNEDISLEEFLYGHFFLTMKMHRSGELFLCRTLEFTNNRPGDSA